MIFAYVPYSSLRPGARVILNPGSDPVILTEVRVKLPSHTVSIYREPTNEEYGQWVEEYDTDLAHVWLSTAVHDHMILVEVPDQFTLNLAH